MEFVLKKTVVKSLCLPIFASPLKTGAGFKPEHLPDILQDDGKVGFFEVDTGEEADWTISLSGEKTTQGTP